MLKNRPYTKRVNYLEILDHERPKLEEYKKKNPTYVADLSNGKSVKLKLLNFFIFIEL